MIALETFINQDVLKEKIQIFMSIRSGQKPLWDDPQRGLTSDFRGDKEINNLQISCMKQEIPIANILEFSSYKKGIVQKALIKLVQEFDKLQLFERITVDSLIMEISEHLPRLVTSHLKQKELQLPIENSPLFPIFSAITDAVIQPSLMYISSKCEKKLLDGWGLTLCPVCGQIPSVVVKPETEVWRFKCSFCLTEYKTDIFTCPNCNTKEIDSRDYLIIESNQVFEIASCKECNHYFKIINRDKILLGEEIPEGLEDIYTYFLDEIASKNNLVRIDYK